MYCTKCGNESVEGSIFCNKCGNRIRDDEEFNNANVLSDEVTNEELKLFVGIENQEYYMSQWSRFKGTGKNLFESWNWAAFFLTFFWLAYRKMYLYAIVISAAIFIVMSILPGGFASSLGIMVDVCLGVFGNKLYYDNSKKEIIKIKNSFPDLSNQEKAIVNKGGTSLLFASIFIVVHLGIIFTWGVVLYLN